MRSLYLIKKTRGECSILDCVETYTLEYSRGRIQASVRTQNVELIEEIGDAPRVDVPEHVIAEVVRGLLSNG